MWSPVQFESIVHETFQFLKNPRTSSTRHFDFMIDKGSIHLVRVVNKLACVTEILKTMSKMNFDILKIL